MRIASLMISIGVLTMAGCHTMRFVVSDAPQPTTKVVERNSYFFWGLVPNKRIDVSEKCPGGVVAIHEQTTGFDVAINILTLDIWTPRTTTYYCAAEVTK